MLYSNCKVKYIELLEPVDRNFGVEFYEKSMERRKFKNLKLKLIIFAVLICIGCIFSFYQNYHIIVTEYEYKADFNCRIVQISDLHNQLFGIKQERLIDEVRECAPDIIFVTGDVVDSGHTRYENALVFFERALEIAPVYYITGNHEDWLLGDEFNNFLSKVEAMGVYYIDGKVISLENMIIAGTDGGFRVGNYNWNEDDKLKILLAHEPARYANYASVGADIVFSGHVHGGQAIIPGKGGLISPDMEFFPDLYKGEYHFGDMTMYISAGLGNSVLPLRINNYPEIVVVDIINSQS